jgi:ribosomal protein S18 acetylase RimI-like enzyme
MIREYRATDRAAVYDICVRTANAGGDSRHLYPDVELMPSIFAGPYVTLEPSLAFVLTDGGRAVGYVIGTANTTSFVDRYRSEWLPRLSYPPLTAPPTTPSEQMIALMHNPERMVVPSLTEYPAHLHIDLLPKYQGKGHGRALMDRLRKALRAAGARGVHLGMVTENVKARGFYDHLGFNELPVPNPGPLTYLGQKL